MHPKSVCQFEAWLLCFFPLMLLRRQWVQAHCHPCGKPGWHSWLLVLPFLFDHLGSGTTDRFLFHSLLSFPSPSSLVPPSLAMSLPPQFLTLSFCISNKHVKEDEENHIYICSSLLVIKWEACEPVSCTSSVQVVCSSHFPPPLFN